MLLALDRISVLPGQTLVLRDVDWDEFEVLLDELGENRGSRIAYYQKQLEIMAPLPEHEIDKELVGDLVKALLEELDIEFYPLGSTTFKNKLLGLGLEPDSCFYITNEAKVRGLKRWDAAIDPPPDLALEVDLISRTHLDIYAQLGVPEVWRFKRRQLEIQCLEQGEYRQKEASTIFPDFDLKQIIPAYLQRIDNEGRNKTIKAFRAWVRSQINGKDNG
ncbi:MULTISPECIES: Uma2 family endonuclease [unclassified Synechocystis]|uniref:Uma2 family endonuclease n=1 Tax=unclassified Synechocystis TaxID=2640012 RepID=UPI0003F5943D|nr:MULTISPECIES: Uma2 family endonuclease [unclassified Synechocystis]AIE74483.1 Flavodoxin reductases (ferredoxin-NADPH reductases) family 1 [Synechocystis sp. PCC 6714]MCT0254754.1 Uma2 family endonuclease [Synechocystis sp. CS-94]